MTVSASPASSNSPTDPGGRCGLNANYTDYQHQEVEGSGAVGTVFSSEGYDLRLEAEHAQLGPLRGVLGVQHEDFNFSALGDEAFVPKTNTRKTGLFALEEMAWVGGMTVCGCPASSTPRWIPRAMLIRCCRSLATRCAGISRCRAIPWPTSSR